MAGQGEFGATPDAAIFADTQWEPKEVYEHLEYLKTQVAIPILTITAGDIHREFHRTGGGHFTTPPLYILKPNGEAGMVQRQCTKDYKIIPIQRAVTKLLAERTIKRGPGVVEQWIGISLDEVGRMK